MQVRIKFVLAIGQLDIFLKIFCFTLIHFQSRELEIEIRYRDWRSICAFTVVKLGDIVEPSARAGMVLNLEPQGDLFAEVYISWGFFLFYKTILCLYA